MPTLNELCAEYAETRLIYDEAHAHSTQKHHEHQAAKAKLIEEMEKSSASYDPTDLPLKFTLKDQFSIACNVKNEAEVKEWVHETWGDLAQFTEEKLVKTTVQDSDQGSKVEELGERPLGVCYAERQESTHSGHRYIPFYSYLPAFMSSVIAQITCTV